MILNVLAATPVGIWLYLLTSRAGYWKMRKYLVPQIDRAVSKRKIVAVVPARNEADVVAVSIRSLLEQELLVALDVVLVDDGSTDGTAQVARAAASQTGSFNRLTVLQGKPLPNGWTGKLWAVSQGIREAETCQPDFLLLTDADIFHAPGAIARLLSVAEAGNFDLSSVMVRLATATFAERLLIPAFVYFFLQLYPPDWIANKRARTAGAAGGCMLLRSETLRKIGGIQAIAGKVIDDCALAALVKQHGGSVWMGLSTETTSLRSYGGFAGVGNMISRSAFNQLQHSTLLLAGTLGGLLITCALPPMLLLSKRRSRVLLGSAAWLMMTASYGPAVKLYRRPRLASLSLPLVALFYAGATIHSAFRFWTGRGGEWKGRIQDRRG